MSSGHRVEDACGRGVGGSEGLSNVLIVRFSSSNSRGHDEGSVRRHEDSCDDAGSVRLHEKVPEWAAVLQVELLLLSSAVETEGA